MYSFSALWRAEAAWRAASACWRAMSSRSSRSWRCWSSAFCSIATCSRRRFWNSGSGLGLTSTFFGSGLGLGFGASAMSGFLTGGGSGFTTGSTLGGGGLGASTAAGGGRGASGTRSTVTVSGACTCQRTPRKSTAASAMCTNADSTNDRPRACSYCRPRSRTALTGRLSLSCLHLQADLLHALPAQLVHDLQHGLIARVLVAADENRELAFGSGFQALDEAGKLRARQGLLIDHPAARVALTDHDTLIGLDEDFQRREARRARLVHRRQVDDAGGDERRRDHEDDEQHEHHVHVGHDVDLVHRPASAMQRRHYRTDWRCRMFENSSMKLSNRLASRSMSCEDRKSTRLNSSHQ